ncbi:hypothetical protein EIM50_16715 [Pseudoxanthomonas sp. SGD-10]|nr:hypothetical protein EIM50_16715 [Pseudoxanthomonas sp. SGD-10]
MLRLTRHIQKAKHTLWLCLALFALSPCVVKLTLLDASPSDYVRPLNKVKLASQATSCQITEDNIQETLAANQVQLEQEFIPVLLSVQQISVNTSFTKPAYDSKSCSGNSPPKYILYKRLKVHVAA